MNNDLLGPLVPSKGFFSSFFLRDMVEDSLKKRTEEKAATFIVYKGQEVKPCIRPYLQVVSFGVIFDVVVIANQYSG